MWDDKVTARFWAKVDRRGPDECWPWLGARSPGGYGRTSVGGRTTQATHVALLLDGRPLQSGELARHRCDNPPCVNPAHLEPGGQPENMHDASIRGRTARGEGHGRRALDELQVVELRTRRHSGERIAVLAQAFGISEASVSLIARGIKWAHAGGPLTPRDARWDGK